MVLARDWGCVASIDCLFFICFTIFLILGVTTDFFTETWTLVCYETLDLKPSALAGLFLHLSSRNVVGVPPDYYQVGAEVLVSHLASAEPCGRSSSLTLGEGGSFSTTGLHCHLPDREG